MKCSYTIEISNNDPNEPSLQEELWKLLVLLDQEFIPPLSARESTTTMRLSGIKGTEAAGPRAYFEKILQQNIVMAQVEGHWAGFLSFQHNHRLELLGDCNPCNYLTTIGVSPYFRNIGVARCLYRYVLHDLSPELQSQYWATRTWSTNYDHLHLLNNLGFSRAATLENHRGNGIDTIYFVFKLPKRPVTPTDITESSSVELA